MTNAATELLERIASWPDEDIARLDAVARRIEALRNGKHQPTDNEMLALDQAFAELDRDDASETRLRAAFAQSGGS